MVGYNNKSASSASKKLIIHQIWELRHTKKQFYPKWDKSNIFRIISVR